MLLGVVRLSFRLSLAWPEYIDSEMLLVTACRATSQVNSEIRTY